jgi:hypothetical protein
MDNPEFTAFGIFVPKSITSPSALPPLLQNGEFHDAGGAPDLDMDRF